MVKVGEDGFFIRRWDREKRRVVKNTACPERRVGGLIPKRPRLPLVNGHSRRHSPDDVSHIISDQHGALGIDRHAHGTSHGLSLFVQETGQQILGSSSGESAANLTSGWLFPRRYGRSRNPRRSSMDSTPKVRFARDSPLEGTGFEPSVPRKAPGVGSSHLRR